MPALFSSLQGCLFLTVPQANNQIGVGSFECLDELEFIDKGQKRNYGEVRSF